jgi:diaminopimelate epimerase
MRHWSFAKGHGTGNDFVVLLDREAMLDVGEAEVRFLCDRHIGIGGDGLLRAVFAKHIEEWDGEPDLWFMDYRNADGSVAEMCGNGIRVFVRFLLQHDLATGPVVQVATRAGRKEGSGLSDGGIWGEMG